MKNMEWDPVVWQALRDAVSPMPPFVRKRALQTIIEASENFGHERRSVIVEEQDLVRAAREKMPALARQRMLDALIEQGIRVDDPKSTRGASSVEN